MAFVSIDIDAMEQFVKDLREATYVMPEAARTLRFRGLDAGVDVSALADLSDGLSFSELENILMWCERSLTIARQIAASTPGFCAGMMVSFDDSLIPTSSLAQVKADVKDLLDAMGGAWGWSEEGFAAMIASGQIPQQVLDGLSSHTLDPYFAQELARQLSPEYLALFLSAVDVMRQTKCDLSRLSGDWTEVFTFDEQYRNVLDSLAMNLSLASRGTGELRSDVASQWSGFIRDESTDPRDVVLLSLVVSRGAWSDDFVLGVGDALTTRQGDSGMGFWSQGARAVYDPASTSEDGSGEPMDPYWCVNPWAELFQTSVHNPEVVRQWFTGPDRVTVPLPGGETTINRYLWDLVHDPGIDDRTIDALSMAVLLGGSAPQSVDPKPWQAMVQGDFTTLGPALQEECEQYARDHPWWQTAGHTLLDVAGMFTEAGDLANAVWYTSEGDMAEAGWSAAGAIPIFGLFKPFRTVFRAIANTVSTKRRLEIAQATAQISNRLADQRQARHVFGTQAYWDRITNPLKNGPVAYFSSQADADAVWSAFKNGNATVLGFKANGDIVIQVKGVTGTWLDVKRAPNGVPTDVFFIKGTTHPSIVPYDPNF